MVFIYLFISDAKTSIYAHTQTQKKKEISTLKDAQLKNTSLKQS